MMVAVAGGGSVGMAVAADLKEHGHDVFILEVDPEQVARFQPHVDVRWIVADACEVSSLKAAGMAEVDVMVAATGDDEDNLVISLLSKQEFAVPRVIARVNNASNQWLFTESWGVDVPVSTPQLYTALVEEAVSIGSLVHLMSFEGASAHLLEVTLAEESPACGLPIGELGLPRESAIVAIVRRDHMIIPDPETPSTLGTRSSCSRWSRASARFRPSWWAMRSRARRCRRCSNRRRGGDDTVAPMIL